MVHAHLCGPSCNPFPGTCKGFPDLVFRALVKGPTCLLFKPSFGSGNEGLSVCYKQLPFPCISQTIFMKKWLSLISSDVRATCSNLDDLPARVLSNVKMLGCRNHKAPIVTSYNQKRCEFRHSQVRTFLVWMWLLLFCSRATIFLGKQTTGLFGHLVAYQWQLKSH